MEANFVRPPADLLGVLSHIVVDELSNEVAGLVVCEWPRVDHRGRLRVPGRSWRVGANLIEFHALLANRKLPHGQAKDEALLRREVRIGDVFAAKTRRPPGRAAVPKVRRWLTPPIYDISGDAREAAKAALNAAVAPTMGLPEVEQIAAELAKKR